MGESSATKKRLNKLLITMLLFLYAHGVLALDCENESTTLEINACGQIELDKAEQELNQVYARVLKKMDEISKSPSQISDKSGLKMSLIDAQRLWVKFRKADCDTTYIYFSDGTIRQSMYLSCMINKATKRTDELKSYETSY